MPILRERIEWSRQRRLRSPDLKPEEQTRVKVALAFLCRRTGSWQALATKTGIKKHTLQVAATKRGGVSAGVALMIARAAGVPIEDILRGAWPVPNTCPMCGQTVGSDHA